jgi:RNA polymerase sigma-70 factor (ECF subfamily)
MIDHGAASRPDCPASAVDGRTSRHRRDQALVGAIDALRAQGRHHEAQARYGELVGCHQRRACGIAYRYLGDAADADEAVQDAFVKAYANLSFFRQELAFEVWFTRILTNHCLDRLRARRRRGRWLTGVPAVGYAGREFLETVAAATASPEEQVLRRERRVRLIDALKRLPKGERSLIVWSHIEGLTSVEVGARTGMPPSTIRVRLFRAIRRLRALLVDGAQAHGGAASGTASRTAPEPMPIQAAGAR